MTKYLPLGGQRASDSEERIQSALRAALSALHNLLTAITDPVLTADISGNKRQKNYRVNVYSTRLCANANTLKHFECFPFLNIF